MCTREIDKRDVVRVVSSNNLLRATGLEDISLKARKLLYLAIAQCKKEDRQFYQYSISAADFANLMDIVPQAVYKEADALTDELMHGFIKYKPEGKKGFVKFSLFEQCMYLDGMLTFKMSKDMTPILINLKKDFTQPLLSDFMHMRSNFSMVIWHLMQREMKSRKTGVTDVVEFELTLEELRSATGTTNKFERLSQFKAKVLDKAILEIKDNCGVLVTYANVKKGRTVTGFRFTVKSLYYINEAEIPEHIKKSVEAGKRRIAAEQQKRGIQSIPEHMEEELPMPEPEPQHHRPLTQMEKEQYQKQTEQAEQLDIFSFLSKQ